MPYEPKDGDGTLFDNNRRDNDRAPDMTGTLLLNGETLRIAGWWKGGQGGKSQFLSLRVSKPEARQEQRQQPPAHQNRQQAAPRPQPAHPPVEEDEIPF